MDVKSFCYLADGSAFQSLFDENVVVSFEDLRFSESSVLIFSGLHDGQCFKVELE